MIVIVDYGVGNLRSVENMARTAGLPCKVSGDPIDLKAADKIVLPGVGHFEYAMQRLHSAGLFEPLNWFALEARRPVLGICLGGQIIGKASEEGDTPGLGWIDMTCKRFPAREGFPVPRVGWGEIDLVRPSALILPSPENRYYFVHSYYIVCANDGDVVAQTDYSLRYTCAVNRDNIYGVQFHPEKSHRFGLAMFRSFGAL